MAVVPIVVPHLATRKHKRISCNVHRLFDARVNGSHWSVFVPDCIMAKHNYENIAVRALAKASGRFILRRSDIEQLLFRRRPHCNIDWWDIEPVVPDWYVLRDVLRRCPPRMTCAICANPVVPQVVRSRLPVELRPDACRERGLKKGERKKLIKEYRSEHPHKCIIRFELSLESGGAISVPVCSPECQEMARKYLERTISCLNRDLRQLQDSKLQVGALRRFLRSGNRAVLRSLPKELGPAATSRAS